MKTRIAMIVVLASLAGCSSEIDQIKEGRLDAYPDFTVGQAFNNRDVCKQTTWESFEDERGRTIVEYRCDIVGVDTFYQKQAETQLNKLLREQEQGGAWNSLIREEQNKIERLEQKLEREIAGDSMFTDSTRQEIAEARKQLAEYIASKEAYTIKIAKRIEKMKENIALVPEMSAHEYFQWTILENGTFRLVSGGIVESFPEELPFTGREFEYKNVHDPLSAVYSNEVPNYEKYRGLLAARAFLRQVEAH